MCWGEGAGWPAHTTTHTHTPLHQMTPVVFAWSTCGINGQSDVSLRTPGTCEISIEKIYSEDVPSVSFENAETPEARSTRPQGPRDAACDPQVHRASK